MIKTPVENWGFSIDEIIYQRYNVVYKSKGDVKYGSDLCEAVNI